MHKLFDSHSLLPCRKNRPIEIHIHDHAKYKLGKASTCSIKLIPDTLKLHIQLKQKGLTLLEMAIVVSILAITAVVILPSISSTNPYKLNNASRELISAIRYARAEAIRTHISHGIIFSTFNETAKLYSLPSGSIVYDVYHPIDKKLYTLNLKNDAATAGTDLLSYSINYTGIPINLPNLGFNTNGNPKFNFFGTDYLLSASATVTLSYAGQTSTVIISPIGRVTAQ